MNTRRVEARISICGKDVSENINPYLRSLTYTDELSGKADSCELEFADTKRLFMSKWFFPRAEKLSIELVRYNWHGEGVEHLPLNDFEIDEVKNSYPPDICKLKAVSIPQNSNLRQHDESKSFENIRLSELAGQIALTSGVPILFKTLHDPLITRAEQGEMSRLAFLQQICADNGLALKFSLNTLVLFEEEELERQKPVKIFERDNSTILHFDAQATLQEIYKSCEVSYKNPRTDELYKAKYGGSGKVLKINQHVNTQGEAERLAKKKLQEKNKGEIKIRLKTVGDFCLLAGSCISLTRHGFYDGRYLIEKATHSLGKGYETSLELRRCLSQ